MPIDEMITVLQLSTWVTTVALLAMSALTLVLAQLRTFRRLLTHGFVSHTAVPAPAWIIKMLTVAEGRRISGFAVGGIVGVIAATYLVYFVGADRAQPATLFLLGSFAIAAVIGRAVASCLGALTSVSSTVRVANVRHRGVSDYLPAWALITTRITVASAVAMLAILTISPFVWDVQLAVFPTSFSVAAVVSALAVVLLILFEASTRIIARLPQRRESEIALAWDDALRSSAIRDLASATWLLGLFGLFFGIGEIALALSPVAPPGIATALAFNIVGTAALVAVLAMMLLPHTRRYAFRRLHPELIEKSAL